MSNKVYGAKEAAIAVLKKAEELLKKSEIINKYETENSKKLGYKPYGVEQKKIDRAYDAFEVIPESKKTSSDDTRQAHEERPGKNAVDKKRNANPKYGSEPKDLGKTENPDKEEDAKLGEKVEHEVEEHMLDNKDAEKEEGHKIFDSKKKKDKELDKSENFEDLYTDLATLAGEYFPEELEKSEKLKKKYEGFKAVEEKAKESGAKDPAAVAASVGRKKYGKKAFQEAAAKGKKMGKAEVEKCEIGMDKHGLSPEEIDARLNKTGLSPEQIKAHLDKKAKGDYSQALASKDIKEEMHHDWPGGDKQAVAVGINEAKAGKDVTKGSEEIHDPKAFVPIKHGVSAKLAKFKEWKFAKEKAKQSAHKPESASEDKELPEEQKKALGGGETLGSM